MNSRPICKIVAGVFRELVSRLVLLCAVGIVSSLSRPACAEHEGKIQVLLLGDSTTEGLVVRKVKPAGPHLEQVIEQLLAAERDLPPAHVINASLSGDTIQRFLDSGRYDKVAARLPGLDYVFIRYGINDYSRREDFHKNFPEDFHGLIARLRKDHPGAIIIPVTVIPYLDEQGSSQVNFLVKQVAEKEQLPLFDLYPQYLQALKKHGINSLNYRQYPVEKIPEKYRLLIKPYIKPYVTGDQVFVLDNELDEILGDLPDWYGNRHPNLAGCNVIAFETAKCLAEKIRNARTK